MEKYLNIVHYILYKGFCWLFLHTLKINPLFYFYKIPLIRKRLIKQGIDPEQDLYKSYLNSEGGFCTTHAGGILTIMIILLLIGTIIDVFLIYNIRLHLWSLIAIPVLALIVTFFITHVFIFKDDQYIKYTRTFEKASKSWKIKWVWITAGILIASIFFAFGSLVWYIKLVML